MKIPRVQKGYRHLNRYRQIVGVFVKYGFAQFLDRMNVAVRVRLKARLKKQSDIEVPTLSPAHRLRLALEDLGPTFIKLGQLLSTRSFLLPADFIRELSKLQDEVKAVPFEDIKTTIESDLDLSLEQIFQKFNAKSVASASVAQVHFAQLRTGEKVVVKVQRPNIRRVIDTDIDIMKDLASLIERYIEESQQYNPVEMVEELSRSMKREIDFSNEAVHIEKFAGNFRNDKNIHVPRIYGEWCTSNMLTLEYIDGIKISDIDKLKAADVDLKKIAHLGTQFILKQVFEDGFFHADPHPGNLFVTKEGKIAPIDFGIMGLLDEWLMDEISDLLLGVWRRDVEMILRVFVNLGALDIETDQNRLRTELSEFLNTYYGLPLKKINMKKLFEEGIEIMARHRLRIPPNLFLLIKTIGTYEDLGRKLDPEYNFVEEIKPLLHKVILRRISPQRLSYETSKSMRDFYDLLKIMPRELELILKRMRKGHLAIELQHRGLEKLIQEMDRSFNRLSFSLIIASLMMASSLIFVFSKGPLIFGLPFLGIVGYIIAGILGIGLIVAILRSGKL